MMMTMMMRELARGAAPYRHVEYLAHRRLAPVRRFSLAQHRPCAALCSSVAWMTTSASSPSSDDVVQRWKIDPRRLPSTIPGISQEELAARMEAHHSAIMSTTATAAATASASAASSNTPHPTGVSEMHHPESMLTREVEVMRRALPPTEFAEYMRQVGRLQRAEARERVKIASMSPTQLYRYQQKKRRRRVWYEWGKTLMLLTACIGTGAVVLSLFAFFY